MWISHPTGEKNHHHIYMLPCLCLVCHYREEHRHGQEKKQMGKTTSRHCPG